MTMNKFVYTVLSLACLGGQILATVATYVCWIVRRASTVV